MENEPTLQEIREIVAHLDYERGFYLEFRNGGIYAGKRPTEGVKVIEI